MELISVITPYYKKKFFIKEAVLSILGQTYSNLEIIIVYDDESLDDLKYIKEIVALDKRIHLIINEKNIGAGLSRNLAIESSNGIYIAFLDSDDIWKENKIKEQVDFMKKNHSKISHTSYEIIDSNKNVTGKRIARNFNKINDLLKSCDIGLSTVMIEKKIFTSECSFVNLKTKEDFTLWLKLLKQNYTIQGLNSNLTYWRKSKKSLSTSILQRLIDGYRVYYIHMNFNFFKSIYYLFCLSINFLKK